MTEQCWEKALALPSRTLNPEGTIPKDSSHQVFMEKPLVPCLYKFLMGQKKNMAQLTIGFGPLPEV